jgi:hypothetical protein
MFNFRYRVGGPKKEHCVASSKPQVFIGICRHGMVSPGKLGYVLLAFDDCFGI